MDDCELDLIVKELEADQTEALKYIDRELEKRTTTTPVDDYIRLQKVGQGTFGEVFKVQHKISKEFFALKRLKMEKETEGFPVTALREVRILQSLHHENIVSLVGICHQKNPNVNGYRYEFFLLFELCDHDLAGLLNRKLDISLEIKKSISKQLLTGIQFLHSHNILHRDLKASNILIARNGCLKIADFGLARPTVKSYISEKRACYTARVVTLWYRPPEILFMDRNYGKSVDLWGAGCIIAELWNRGPLMPGETEMSQLNLIINLCGSITPAVWPGVDKLEAFKRAKLPMDVRRNLREKLAPSITTPSAIDLIDRLLVLDPRGRLTAELALRHTFFLEDPPPGDLSSLSQNGGSFLEYLSSRSRHQKPPQQFRQFNNGRQGGVAGAGARAGGYRVDNHQQQHEVGSIHFDRVF